MNKLVHFVCAILTIATASCESSSIEKIEAELKKKATDEMVRVLPTRFQSESIERILNEDRSRQLAIPSLRDGFNRFQLRVWEDFSDRTGRLFTFKNNENNWTAELYQYRYQAQKYSALRNSRLAKPKSGWENFINKLLDLEVLKLPDFVDLKSYDTYTDENYVTFEIAKDGYYRIYEYPSPYLRQNNFEEAKKVIKIIDLIKSEFGLD